MAKESLDLTPMIERFEAVEVALGVRLEGLCAWWDAHALHVAGEVWALDGLVPKINLRVTVYDNLHRVLDTRETSLGDYDEPMVPFATAMNSVDPDSTSLIRVHPQDRR